MNRRAITFLPLLLLLTSCPVDPPPCSTPPNPCINYNDNTDPGCNAGTGPYDYEPNNQLTQASFVENPMAQGEKITGKVGGDSDFFYVRAPFVAIDGEPNNVSATFQGSNLRGCVFVTCREGHTTTLGCTNGTLSHLPEGFAGCCTTTDSAPLSTVSVSYQCDRSDILEARMFLLTSRSDEKTDCADYSITYSF